MIEVPERLQTNRFPKNMRVTRKSQLDALFSAGESFIAYPLRVIFVTREITDDNRISVLVSVSKRKFKRAVKRNRMKRLIRENFRLQHHELETALKDMPLAVDIAFLYVKDELAEFPEINKAMTKAIGILKVKLQKN